MITSNQDTSPMLAGEGATSRSEASSGAASATSLANPYKVGVPIRNPKDFYGRAQPLQETLEQISKLGCVNVVGERRSGKTSFLFYLCHPEARAHYGVDTPEAAYVYLDAEICPQSPGGFFREVFEKLQSEYPQMAPRIAPLAAWGPESPTEAGQGLTSAAEQRVRAILQALAEGDGPGPRRLVLLIDEFERIARCDGFAPRFFVFLRGLSINYGVSYVVATSKLLPECCPYEVISSPFPNIFRTVRLGPFTRQEYEDFIRGTSLPGGPPMGEIQEQIADMAGYMPYLVQMACWRAFNAWQEFGNWQEALPVIRRRFEEDAQAHFAIVWERYLDRAEREALQSLVGDGQPFPDVTHLLESEGVSRVVRDLARKGYIGSSVFADYVRRQFASPPASAVPSQGVYVDVESGNVYLEGQLLDPPLPKHQYLLLKLLFENKGKICTPYMIVEAVWSEDYIDQVDDQRIAQLIRRLRQRIETQGRPWRYIVTVRGRGLTLGDGRPTS